MKTWWSGVIAPRILNLSTSGQLHVPAALPRSIHWIGDWVGPRTVWTWQWREKSISLLGIEPRSIPSLVTILTQLHQLRGAVVCYFKVTWRYFVEKPNKTTKCQDCEGNWCHVWDSNRVRPRSVTTELSRTGLGYGECDFCEHGCT